MRRAGRVVAEMHERIRQGIRPGVTTAELDRIGREVLERRGATSNFLGYGHPPFPAVICASPNEVLVHGIPDDRLLEEGDIVSIDCGAVVDGWHGDAAFTIGVGEIDPEHQRLIDVTEASLRAGIAELHDGRRLGDLGHAIQTVVESAGFSVVREYVGHAIGREMHERPDVPNYGQRGSGAKIQVGDQRRSALPKPKEDAIVLEGTVVEPLPTPCSGSSSRTATRCWPTSPGRCACTTSASSPAIASRWS
jgi:methionyl aminopeptidase